MSTFKPVISSGSRIHDTEGRYGRRRKRNEPKGKKAIGKDIGKLTEILNMPLEVFFEVASYLNPVDILQLARTSKELRGMLLSRSARSVWIAARRNIVPRMPDCPEHVNEAQYASLVFERTCNACGVNQSVNVDYAIPVRLCGACWKANVRNGGKLAREAGFRVSKAGQEELFNLMPAANLATYQYRFNRVAVLNQTSRLTFYEPEFSAVAKQYQELIAGKDQKALQEFVNERKADAIRRANLNLDIVEWEKELQSEKYKVEGNIQQERIAAIENKLRELGYEPSEIPPYDHQVIQMLHQPRYLTSRIWNTIRPKLVAILDKERQRHAEEEFKLKWSKRRAQFSTHYDAFLKQGRKEDARKRTLPGFQDAMVLSQDILTGAEPDTDVTPGEYSALEERVLAHADEYLARAARDLVALMRKADAQMAEKEAPQKVKKSRGGKARGKGKKKAMESNSESDEEPDKELDDAEVFALLDAPTALFSCRYNLSGHMHCSGLKPFLGQVEHWQQCHSTRLWSTEYTQYFINNYHRSRIERTLEMFELPKDATMTAVQDAISEGRWGCSCGYNAVEKNSPKPEYLLYFELMTHFDLSKYNAPNLKHTIVKPPPTSPPPSPPGSGWRSALLT